MRNRIAVAAGLLLGCASVLGAQENMFKIDLVPSGSMIALNEPTLKGGTYAFEAWPDGAPTSLKQMRVRKITRLTGRTHDTVYQVELIPTGTVAARDNPTLRGNQYVFHTLRDGRCMSLRQTDVQKITPLTGDKAFWVEQQEKGASKIGNLAMQGGGNLVEIGSPATQGGSSQAGPTNLNAVGTNNGANSSGNWYYQGTPGVSDAWAPANSRVDHPGDVPRMSAATDGNSAPH
jgi:hypothetical protein